MIDLKEKMKDFITVSEFIDHYKINRHKVSTLIKNKMHNGIYKAMYRPCKGETLRTRIYFDRNKVDEWVKDNPDMMDYLIRKCCPRAIR